MCFCLRMLSAGGEGDCHGAALVGAFQREKSRHDQCAAWTMTVEICTKKRHSSVAAVAFREDCELRDGCRAGGISPLSLPEDAVAMRW
jgi:hypothetical protein